MKEHKQIAPLKEKEHLYPENRTRTPWRSARFHLVITTSIIVLVVLLAVAIVGGYFFNWNWTGFGSSPAHIKTLWDWLQLLIIPAVLAVVGYAIIFTIRNNEQPEREIDIDNQREVALQTYIDRLSELLLHEHLRESQPVNEVRKIARVRTLTILSRLDSERKGSVLQFLHESHLIDKGKPILDLTKADLVRANLQEADLSGANLARANLQEADLSGATLKGANLSGATLDGATLLGANLEGANLLAAILDGADLTGADLTGARVTQEKLKDRV